MNHTRQSAIGRKRSNPGAILFLLSVLSAFVATVSPVLQSAKADESKSSANDNSPAVGKLDDGLDDAERTYPVFVRMTDQLLGGRGDYERFCEEHREAPRRGLRPQIVRTL